MIDRFKLGRRALLGSAAGAAAFGLAGTGIGAEAAGDRLHLCRAARRLRLQPGARRGGRHREEDAGRQGGRGGEGAGDGRRREIDGEHDQPRRRHAALPDLVRLLRPAHAEGWRPSIPNIQFRHCGGLWTEGKHPKNTGSYFGYIDEAQYLAGIVAGATSKSGKLGFVAAKPIPQVLRNINAFTLGAQSVNPKITTQVIFTGDWSMPVKEAEATNSMIAQGVDVVTCHVDSPKVVIETAERAGIFSSSGYHCNQAKLAPKGYLTGAEWNWEKVYTDMVNDMKAGKAPGNFVRGGLKEGFVRTSAYGPAAAAAGKDKADAAKAAILNGSLAIFKGRAQGQQGQRRHPGRAPSYAIDRAQAREHELPGRGRDRLDVVERAPSKAPVRDLLQLRPLSALGERLGEAGDAGDGCRNPLA